MTTTDTLRRLGARPAASLPRRGLLAVFLALALIAAACGGDSQDTAGGEQTTTQQPEPEAPDPDPDPEPEPEVAEPEPEPEPEPEVAEPAPEPEVAEPEPEPEPEVAEPEPGVAVDEPEPEPVAEPDGGETGGDDTETDDTGTDASDETDDTGTDASDETDDTGTDASDETDDTDETDDSDETDDTGTDASDETDDTGTDDTGTDASDETDDTSTDASDDTDTSTDASDDTDTSTDASDETDDTSTDASDGTDTSTDASDETDDTSTDASDDTDTGTDASDETDDTSTDASDETDDTSDETDDTSDETDDGDDSAANQAPTFGEGDSAARRVVENASPGDPVGDPMVAGDGDGDLLIYSLSGADAASFGIDFLSGQITTVAALDHATRATYTLTVEVSDSKDADGNTEQPRQTDDTIEVTVTVDPWKPTLTVYRQGDTSAPVTSVDGAGPQTFTLVGKNWTGLHTTPAAVVNNPVLLLTSCLVPGQGEELDFFRQCDSDGLYTFAGPTVRVDEGSQDLSSLYASDKLLRDSAASNIGRTLAALDVAGDGSFRLDMPVDVPASGVIIIALVGVVSFPDLMSPDLITIVKAVTVEIPA